MHVRLWILCAALLALGPGRAAAADGLEPASKSGDSPWARWQGRTFLSSDAPVFRTDLGSPGTPGLQIRSVSLLRDYYVTRSLFGAAAEGGLHATSGLILNPGSQPWMSGSPFGAQTSSRQAAIPGFAAAGDSSGDAGATVPYLGLGYLGTSAKGGWRFSADVGVVALAAGNVVRFGQVFKGSRSVDDVVRDMRVAPVLQLGVSYAF